MVISIVGGLFVKKIFIILCIFWMGFIAYNTSQTGESSNNTSIFITEGIINKTQSVINNNVNNSSNPFDNMVDTPNTYAPIDEPSKQNETVDVSKDPFESFGQSIDLSDDDLPF